MEELKALAQEFTHVREILTQTFFNPLQDLFTNFFETGKFAFKSFADAVLKEIQRLVARIIATGIIKLLASILVPGGAVAVAATGLKSVSTGALADFLGGGVRNPSFGGVQGGGLGMSGQVALVLRGQDLVGAINRTNTTINRVG
jgi:lambda family phage tail tape measure protein